jgi:hypothetical protein
VFKCRDMDHAIELWSKHPCLGVGDALEIRPVDKKINDLIAERHQRLVMDAR